MIMRRVGFITPAVLVLMFFSHYFYHLNIILSRYHHVAGRNFIELLGFFRLLPTMRSITLSFIIIKTVTTVLVASVVKTASASNAEVVVNGYFGSAGTTATRAFQFHFQNLMINILLILFLFSDLPWSCTRFEIEVTLSPGA